MAHHVLADACGARGADFVVDVETGAEDRRIADAARQFVGHAARRATAREIAVLREREQRDGVVAGRLLCARRLLLPRLLLRIERAHVDGLESLRERKPPRAFADEHHVLRVFHHASRGADRMHDALEPRDAAGTARLAIHDARVELHVARGVGPTAETDGAIGRQLLDCAHALFDGVERRCAALQFLHRAVGADLAEGPRRDRDGQRACGLMRRTRRSAGRSEDRGEQEWRGLHGVHAAHAMPRLLACECGSSRSDQ